MPDGDLAPLRRKMRETAFLPLFSLCLAAALAGCAKKQPIGLIDDTAEQAAAAGTDSLQLNVYRLDYGFSDSIKQFYVVNTTDDYFKWTLAADQGWISTDPISGAIASGESTKVRVAVCRSGLADGSYSGTVSVSANRQTRAVAVAMSVYQDAVSQFDFLVSDAEYSKQLDRIVLVGTGPNQLAVLDPETWSLNPVSLALAPACVSVSPDGMHAAVGHNGYVSYADLSTGAVESVYPVGCDVLDIVLAGNGYMYAFPRSDQWTKIFCIRLSDGAVTQQTGNYIYAGTLGRLHPSGDAIYGANNGLSPSDIEKYSITSGTAAYLYDSPYHGDYSMSGNLWFSEDGLRIFVRGGNVFASSTVQAQDMVYTGSLSGIINTCRVSHLTHSAANGKVFVAPYTYYWSGSYGDTLLQIYDYSYLALESKVRLPKVINNNILYDTRSNYVFVKNDGTRYYALVDIDPASAALNRWGLAVFSYPENKVLAKR